MNDVHILYTVHLPFITYLSSSLPKIKGSDKPSLPHIYCQKSRNLNAFF